MSYLVEIKALVMGRWSARGMSHPYRDHKIKPFSTIKVKSLRGK